MKTTFISTILAFLCLASPTKAFDFNAKLTAYNEREPDHKKYGNLNCQGLPLKVGQCAADLRYHTLGDQIRIDGMGTYVVADCGSGIKGPNRFDIYVHTMAECRAFGVKYREASMLSQGHTIRSETESSETYYLHKRREWLVISKGFAGQSTKSQQRLVTRYENDAEDGGAMVAAL